MSPGSLACLRVLVLFDDGNRHFLPDWRLSLKFSCSLETVVGLRLAWYLGEQLDILWRDIVALKQNHAHRSTLVEFG